MATVRGRHRSLARARNNDREDIKCIPRYIVPCHHVTPFTRLAFHTLHRFLSTYLTPTFQGKLDFGSAAHHFLQVGQWLLRGDVDRQWC
jgi:hypothetical protein